MRAAGDPAPSAPRAALLTLFVAGLALRPQIIGVVPLLPRIEQSLDISHTVAGLLATIPVLCMGAFAPLAQPMLRRFGSRSAIGVSLGVMALFGLARAGAPSAALLIGLTVPVGIAIAVAGTLLPVVVKEEVGQLPTLGTGVYISGINLGATIAAVVAVPLAAVWSWRAALLAFSLATLPVAAAWARSRHATPRLGRRAPLPVGRPVVWLLVAVFTLQSAVFYGSNAWLATAYVDRGWSHEAAGGLTGLLNATSLVVGLAAALAADRIGSRRAYIAGGAAVSAAMTALLAADVGGAWAWSGLLGAAQGVLFTIVMTLPLDVASAPAEVAAATTLMLGLGYVFSALAPLALGALRDATGTFTAPLAVLTVSATLVVAVSPLLSPRRLRAPGAGPEARPLAHLR